MDWLPTNHLNEVVRVLRVENGGNVQFMHNQECMACYGVHRRVLRTDRTALSNDVDASRIEGMRFFEDAFIYFYATQIRIMVICCLPTANGHLRVQVVMDCCLLGDMSVAPMPA